jgi:aspartyl-tRNA(Asn)/glutamyl-tRNA(Gln) amidotransferase subunit C
MSDEITPEIFDHMVMLAALELNAAESEYLRRQLNNQLKAIHELEAIPLSEDIKPTSHGVPYTAQITPAIRADEWQPYPHPEEILAQAPESQDGYIVVPEIPHIDLE